MDVVDDEEIGTLEYESEVVDVLLAGQIGERSSSKLAENIILTVTDEIPVGNSIPAIKRPGDIKQILAVLCRCSEQVQHETLDIFLRLIDSYKNLELCCNEGILLQVIYYLVDARFKDPQSISKLKQIVATLGRHRVSVVDMKMIFRMIAKLRQPVKVAKYSGLVLELLRQFLLEENRFEMFDFSGVESGIILPPLGDWPSSAYTLCLWFRIDTFTPPSSHTGGPYLPRLVSFSSQDGSDAFEVHFQDGYLSVIARQSLTKGGAVARQVFQEQTFDTNKWYFVVLSHQKSFFGSSTIDLVINAERKVQKSLKYPKFEKPFLYGGLGLSICSPNKNHLQGQIASFCLFNSQISTTEIQKMFQEGPNSILEIISSDMESSIKSRLLETTFSSKRVLSYMIPKDTDIFDGNPILAPQYLRGSMLIESPSVRDSIRSVGGVEVILPLFARLPSPGTQPTSMMLSAPSLLIFLSDLVDENVSFMESLVENPKPLAVMAWLLEKADEVHKTIGLIRAIEKLINTVSNNEDTKRYVFESFFFNFDIWSTAAFSVQEELIDTLIRQHKRTQQLPIPISVSRILNILRTYYFYEAEGQPNLQGRSSEASGMRRNESFLKMQALRFETRSLSREEIAQIRTKLLDLSLLICVEKGVVFSTIRTLIFHIEDTQDAHQQMDLLNWLLKLLHLQPQLSGLVDSLQSLDLAPTVSTLIGSRNESVRQIVIRFLSLMLGKQILKPKSTNIDALYTVIFDQLQNYPLDSGTYQVLIDIMAGVDQHQGRASDALPLLKDGIIAPRIFRLLARTEDTKLMLVLVQDVVRILEGSKSNLAIWCDIPSWQELLLDIYSKAALISPNSKELTGIADGISRIFFLEFMSLKNDHRGWTLSIKNLIGFTDMLPPHADGNHIVRQVLCLLLPAICEDLKIFSSEDTQSLVEWSNLVHICWVVEDVAFYTLEKAEDCFVIQSNHKRDSDGVWLDYDLVNECLDSFLPVLISLEPLSTIQELIGLERRFTTNKGGMGRLLLRFMIAIMSEEHIYHSKRPSKERGKLNRSESFEFNIQQLDLILDRYDQCPEQLKACCRLFFITSTIDKWILSPEQAFLKSGAQRMIEKYAPELCTVLKPHFPTTLAALYDRQASANLASEEPPSDDASHDIMASQLESNIETVEMQGENLGAEAVFELWSKSEILGQLHQVVRLYMEEWNEFHQEIGEKLLLARSNFCNQVMNPRVNKEHESRQSMEMLHYSKWQVVLDQRQKFLTEEADRYRNFRHDIRRRRGEAERYWKFSLKALTDDCGPWHSSQMENSQVLYALLDAEDSSRRRVLFKVNKDGSRHDEAVYHVALSNAKLHRESSVIQVDKQLQSIVTTPEQQPDAVDEEVDALNISINFEDNPPQLFDEEVLFCFPCQWIYPLNVVQGEISFTRTTMNFISLGTADNDGSKGNQSSQKFSSPGVERLTSIQHQLRSILRAEKRRYMLNNNALELFISDDENPTMFLSFQKSVRSRVLRVLARLCPNIDVTESSSSGNLQQLTTKWQRREISNFEYLMRLNTAAGRNYNDLTQYPVFPWILTDFKSRRIDLNDPSIYRDLSKPIGALEPNRLAKYLERYKAFESDDSPPYMYSGHYSSTYSVVFFLLRVEPFTTYFLSLQDGRFDVPDRLFHSLEETWNNCLQSSTDVKELIPEMFYMSDLLRNRNRFDLGLRQDGTPVDDVILPPWARTPEEFIRIHREALESDYVSQHLHEWIDLIFGYKQTGKEAIAAHNVFHYLSYEGVNLEKLTDPLQRKSAEVYINLCGQTPKQLFSRPHPSRGGGSAGGLREGWLSPRAMVPAMPLTGRAATPTRFVLGSSSTGIGIEAICADAERIYTLDRRGCAGVHVWTISKGGSGSGAGNIGTNAGIGLGLGFGLGTNMGSEGGVQTVAVDRNPAALGPIATGLVCGGRWVVAARGDTRGRLRVHELDGRRAVSNAQSAHGIHGGGIRCITQVQRHVLTGADDGTICLWDLRLGSSRPVVLRRRLLGHASPVTAIAVHAALPFLLSAAADGSVLVHSFHGPRLWRWHVRASLGSSNSSTSLSTMASSLSLSSATARPVSLNITTEQDTLDEAAIVAHLALTLAPHVVLAISPARAYGPHLVLATLDGRCLQATSALQPVAALIASTKHPIVVSVEGAKVLFRAAADLTILHIHDFEYDQTHLAASSTQNQSLLSGYAAASIYPRPVVEYGQGTNMTGGLTQRPGQTGAGYSSQQHIPQPKGYFRCACFDPDETRLLLGTCDNSLVVLPVDLAALARQYGQI
eukprot:TRINITY_DN3536_c0_g1_i1.p1 TRINITY_DN3536_c0_g1~~TRINITY_DN3536_c0_g1_i1.p1  ORF type:complete len:2280 (-),score=409.51 TRINITY_DN3536_c0_g1_i1:41-6880(-)